MDNATREALLRLRDRFIKEEDFGLPQEPYDLAETERVDLSDPRPAMARSSTVFAVADYVKLDSPELAELFQPSKLPESTVATRVDDSQAGRPDDWGHSGTLVIGSRYATASGRTHASLSTASLNPSEKARSKFSFCLDNLESPRFGSLTSGNTRILPARRPPPAARCRSLHHSYSPVAPSSPPSFGCTSRSTSARCRAGIVVADCPPGWQSTRRTQQRGRGDVPCCSDGEWLSACGCRHGAGGEAGVAGMKVRTRGPSRAQAMGQAGRTMRMVEAIGGDNKLQ
ncbi:hypothetical protein DFH09DRAFT_1271456 [Mycena vulgaris]|nr:hypothetical protein DFH09DRAFT_1271456 [Mycena vulgaris]